jgi:hypothetical protein
MIETMIKESQEDANDNKLRALKNIKYDSITGSWSTGYALFDNYYKYDIVKTNSIVTPFKAMVIYSSTYYFKHGKTKEECLKAPWTVTKSPISDKGDISIYLYKNGKWVYSTAIYSK